MQYFEPEFTISSALQRIDGIPLIATHDGTFHCDEALACFMLKLTKQYRQANIVRTRNADVINACDCVVDVGATFEPEKHRFDHHQSSFAGKFNEASPTKLSSAGLVYVHFGKEIIETLIGTENSQYVPLIFEKTYKNFILHIDAIDNGVEVASDGKPLYNISTHLSARIGYLQPEWNEPQTPELFHERFRKAIYLTGSEFVSHVVSLAKSWLPARTIVADAVSSRHSVHPSGEIVKLEQFCPWKEHLFDLEAELGIQGSIKFVLYADQDKRWRVQCVPTELTSFSCRLPLAKEWRGIRDAELSAKSGIPDCIFVHAGGFIGGNSTFIGALAMAAACLQ